MVVKVLGFVKKQDIPVGDDRWLTVVSPDNQNEVELLLEPIGFAPAGRYQKALHKAGIPQTSFAVEDVDAEHERLTALGVSFRTEPTKTGDTIIAVFEDTCGNLIQVYQV